MNENKQEGLVSVSQLPLARQYLGVTQEKVAAAIGLTKTNYSYIEQGKSDPKWSNIKKIEKYFTDQGIIFLKDGSVLFKQKNT